MQLGLIRLYQRRRDFAGQPHQTGAICDAGFREYRGDLTFDCWQGNIIGFGNVAIGIAIQNLSADRSFSGRKLKGG